MNFKEMMRFIYGLTMGTSTPYLKPTKRFLFPTSSVAIDDRLALFMGGSGICGVLSDGREHLLINVNQGVAAEGLKRHLRDRGIDGGETIVLSSPESDFSAGLPYYDKASEILVGTDPEGQLRRILGDRQMPLRTVREERTLKLAGETVRIVPMGATATEGDVAVFLESRRILFAGALFFNGIHPIVHGGRELDPNRWADGLEGLVRRFDPKLIVPAEGDTATGAQVDAFIGYLRDLADPRVEFSECRKKYDWPEIPGYTSLEENFDLLREKVKSHTTLR